MAGDRRVRGADPTGVQTQTELHEAARATGRTLTPSLTYRGPLVAVVLPELEDQAFPFQRGLAIAKGFFHLVAAPEVDEVAVSAAVDRPAHDSDLVLTLHELAVLTEA